MHTMHSHTSTERYNAPFPHSDVSSVQKWHKCNPVGKKQAAKGGLMLFIITDSNASELRVFLILRLVFSCTALSIVTSNQVETC